ncbi:MAG: protein kinase [Nannocystaceae bacterium]
MMHDEKRSADPEAPADDVDEPGPRAAEVDSGGDEASDAALEPSPGATGEDADERGDADALAVRDADAADAPQAGDADALSEGDEGDEGDAEGDEAWEAAEDADDAENADDAERPARRSLLENWTAYTHPRPGEPEPEPESEPDSEDIHGAVSDALADLALPETDDADDGDEASASHSGILPPPPDRSGADFDAYDEDKDEGPEFFHETVADETLGSSPDWRVRLGTAIAVDVDDDDELDELVPSPSPNLGLPVDDDEDEALALVADHDPRPSPDDDPALGMRRRGPGEGAAEGLDPSPSGLPSFGEALDDDVIAEPVLEIGVPDDDEPELPAAAAEAEEVSPVAAESAAVEAAVEAEPASEAHADDEEPEATHSGRWLKRWTSEMLALPDDEDELRAMVARAEAEREAAAAIEPEPAKSSATLSMSGEIIESELGASASKISMSGEILADLDDVDPASRSGADLEVPLARPRDEWIADDSDPGDDFYGDPFPLDDWQDVGNLEGYVVRGLYRLGASIGRGDSFRVFEATRTDTEEPVVLKLLGPDYPPNEDRAQLFRREARAMARFHDARVARVLDVGTTRDGLSYMALEHLDGSSLSALLATEGPLPWARAGAVVRQVLGVTAALHAKGRIQRTIHPDNIYLLSDDEDGEPRVKLTNVGLTPLATHYRRVDGKLAVTPEGLLGSAEYMAPEVVSGNLPDAQSDVYAAGILLYELLAGRPPFLAESLMGLLKKHLYEEPVTLRATVHAAEIPDGIEGVILKALEKDPDRRHDGIRELAEELAAAEARQREVSRAKNLLSAVDAALWGDDDERMARLAAEAPPPDRVTLHEVPIAPLTDDDMSAEERAAKAAELAKTAAEERAAEASAVAPIPAAPIPAAEPEGDLKRTLLTVVLGVAAVAVLFLLMRPANPPSERATTSAPASTRGVVEPDGSAGVADPSGATLAGATSAGATAATADPSSGAQPADPSAADSSADPSEGAPDSPDPSEGALDPSEGAPLDPSEGAPLDPSEGAPLDPSDGLDPSEGAADPSEGGPVEPSSSSGADTTAAAEPPPAEDKDKGSKPVKALPETLSDAVIRSRLGGVRKQVSKQCGQATGLFAPVGLTVKVRVEVDPQGKAKATPLKSSATGRCAAKIVDGLSFPKSKSGGALVHTFKL